MADGFLIITADDFGYCEQRNAGIVKCFQEKAVTRASIIVNAKATEEAFYLAQRHSIPLGLHLNLTEGSPICHDVITLTGEEGKFLGKFGFRDALSKGTIDIQELYQEIRAQVKKFRQLAGHLPQHVDGHQHIHVLEGVREAFANVLSELNIKETRLPLELGLQDCLWVKPKKRLEFYQSIVEDSIASVGVFEDKGISFSDLFLGMSTMGADMTLKRLRTQITGAFKTAKTSGTVDSNGAIPQTHGETLDRPMVCELMCHVGYPSIPGVGGFDDGPDDFACSTDREHEINLINSSKFKHTLQNCGIRTISSMAEIEEYPSGV